MQTAERIPYETLLRQRRSSSSVPPMQSKGRPSWSISESQPSPSAWHETLDSRSLQSSPHRPALPHASVSHAEAEDWPDLTQLNWEGGATGVVRSRQDYHMHGEFGQNPAKTPQNLDGQVFNESMNGRQQKMNGALAKHTLPLSISLADRPRWGSPNALPSGPQGRPVARSLSALPSGFQGRAAASTTSRARQQLDSSHDSSRMSQVTQPLHTHVSLDSLMTSPRPAADQQDHRAQPLFRDALDQEQLSQPDSTASAWCKDDVMRHQASSATSNGHLNDRGGSEGVPSQQPPPQQPAVHERGQIPVKQSAKEQTGASLTAPQALPSFASPTRSSEAKSQHPSLHALPFRRTRSRQSTGSVTPADGPLLGQLSEGSHQAARGVGVSEGQTPTPGSGAPTPGSAAAPLTSTFRSVFNWHQAAVAATPC